MRTARNTLAVVGFVVASLWAQDAFAFARICNANGSPMWLAYASFLPSTRTLRKACTTETVSSGSCTFTAWQVEAWWRVNPNQCVTVLGGPIVHSTSYFRAEWDDGLVAQGSKTFLVTDNGMVWDEEQVRQGSGTCIMRTAFHDPCDNSNYPASFAKWDTKGKKDATIWIGLQ